jgi:hypothetical protein
MNVRRWIKLFIKAILVSEQIQLEFAGSAETQKILYIRVMESEHFMTCPTCGEIVDKRNPSLVLSHGCWNEETKQFECYDVDGVITFSSAKKISDAKPSDL